MYVAAIGGLRGPLTGDETHFWYNAVTLFSHSAWPTLSALRSYPELNTPLPFVLWGALEHWLHQGVWLPRAVNLTMSWAVALLVARPRAATRRSLIAAAGLLACPYFLFVSARLYTDMPAICFGVFGLRAYLQQRPAWSTLLFVLAIASRQYAVAFPIAILVHETLRDDGGRSTPAMCGAAVATLSLAGWFFFFGGVAPPAAIEAQQIETARLATVIPQHALYLLACAGLYFGAPALLLVERRLPALPPGLLAAAAAIVVCFVVFPPLGNQDVPTVTMGLFDRALRGAGLPASARAAVFCAFAIVAVAVAWRNPLARSLTIVNAAIMLKGHVAWDKYALPLLAALWLLTGLDDDARPVAGRPRATTPRRPDAT